MLLYKSDIIFYIFDKLFVYKKLNDRLPLGKISNIYNKESVKILLKFSN